ncbi:MAG: carboxypeptidase regulatory-like domain-containing protein [Planctomycetota bacterium]
MKTVLVVGALALAALLVWQPWSDSVPGGPPPGNGSVPVSPVEDGEVADARGADSAAGSTNITRSRSELLDPSADDPRLQIRGQVVDAGGRPVEGALVEIGRVDDAKSEWGAEKGATSKGASSKGGDSKAGKDGKGGKAGGKSAPPFVSLGIDLVTDRDGRFFAEIETGDAGAITLAMARASQERFVPNVATSKVEDLVAEFLIELEEGVAVRGTVVGPFEQPIEDAAVTYWQSPGVPVRTDAAGAFELFVSSDRLEPLYLLTEASRHASKWTGPVASEEVGGTIVVDPVVIRLDAASLIRGVVTSEVDGSPVPDATLMVRVAKAVSKATTDAEGRFELESVSPGNRDVRVDHPEFRSHVESVEVPDPQGPSVELSIALDPGRSLTGVVRGPRGEQVVGAGVSVSSGRKSERVGRTDEEGRFELRGLNEGRLRLSVSADGYAAVKDAEVPVDVAEFDVELATSGRFAGQLFDAVTNEPITKFSIRFLPIDGPVRLKGGALTEWHGFSDPEGRFDTGPEGWPIGFEALLDVRAPGYLGGAPTPIVAIGSDEDPFLRLSLERGVSLSGLVLSDVGLPLEVGGLEVWDTTRERRIGGSKKGTDSAGRFVIEDVERGPLVLVVRDPAVGVAFEEFEIPVGVNEWEQTFQLSPRAELRGVLLTSTGRRMPNEPVRLVSTGTRRDLTVRRQTTTDANGEFGFEELPAGPYRLAQLEPPGPEGKSFALFESVIEIQAGGGVQEIELIAPGTGAILGSCSAPVSIPDLAYLRIERVGESSNEAQSRWRRIRQGAFEIRGLEPGRYRLVSRLDEAEGGRRFVADQEVVVTEGRDTSVVLLFDER